MLSSKRLSVGEEQYEFLDKEYKRIIGFWGNIKHVEKSIPGSRYSFIIIFILLLVTSFLFTHLQFNVSSSIKWVLIPMCFVQIVIFGVAGRKITSITRKTAYNKYGGEKFDVKTVQFPFVYYYSIFFEKAEKSNIDISSVQAYIGARMALKKDNTVSKMFASIGVNFLFILVGMMIGNMEMGNAHVATLLIQVFAINTLLLSPIFAAAQYKWDRMRVINQYLNWMRDDLHV